jgi:hypothetical protein
MLQGQRQVLFSEGSWIRGWSCCSDCYACRLCLFSFSSCFVLYCEEYDFKKLLLHQGRLQSLFMQTLGSSDRSFKTKFFDSRRLRRC